jgi:glutamine phosphoribosylpyrophosphate amidotransferase
MCGLVGGVGALHNYDKTTFTQLLCANVFRGAHGTGVFKTYREHFGGKDFFEYTKSVMPSSAFVWEQEYESFVYDQSNVSSLMGHSRHATVGDIKEENCHPFVVYEEGKPKKPKNQRIIGFHNGTIKGKFPGSDDYETDSEALYNLIAERGLKEALTVVYEKAWDVAYALQYYDNDTGEIYLIRNEKRPLWIAKIDHLEEYWWASESGMLKWSLSRSGAKVEWIKQLPVGALLTMSPFNSAKEGRAAIKEDFFTPPVKKPSVTYYTPPARQHSKFGQGTGKNWGNYVKDRKFVRIGQLSVPFTEYQDILQQGCCVCSSPQEMLPEEKEFEQVFLMGSPHDYVCKGCQSSQTWESFNISTDMLTYPKWEAELNAVG